MPRTPRSTRSPVRLPSPWLPVLAPARGPTAMATYLRVHLYGAAVGRSVLDRAVTAVDSGDRARLVPLRAQFDQEITAASGLLSQVTPLGTPGRRLLGLSSAVLLAAVPVGPVLGDPLARLGILEALRTLVVAKRSMWELLAESWAADPTVLLDLAEQAAAQELLLEELRRTYGLAVFQ